MIACVSFHVLRVWVEIQRSFFLVGRWNSQKSGKNSVISHSVNRKLALWVIGFCLCVSLSFRASRIWSIHPRNLVVKVANQQWVGNKGSKSAPLVILTHSGSLHHTKSVLEWYFISILGPVLSLSRRHSKI